MHLNIAVVQFEIEQFAPEKNLAKAERFIQEACTQGAQVIVFPEDFLTGPLPGRIDLADFDQRYVKRFQELAVKFGIDIVPGSIIEVDDNGLYNTTYYIDRSGKILGQYRKINLWLTERRYLQPGRQAIVCSTRFGKIGLAICWDLAFPELFRAMIMQGAQIVFCPSYWSYEDAGVGQRHNPDSEALFVDALCTTRAFEQNIILAFANTAASLGASAVQTTPLGHSQITVPFKGPLQRCDHNREMLFVQTVDTAILTDAETAYEIRCDLKKGLPLTPASMETFSPSITHPQSPA
ncbi:carbon-nitrogen hydrolase family protein [Pedosphaera parvula]|uniref:Nitrilase/cyanide hydratase and apolipoprotein N-acyltransferase n=1 Tax=Pedosphaera parvula (strain Ellin514) TaxID=320771 RepID=B9XPJ8_PEDPL|nr:carbon-nitrogen hydrolase family protein [Pedosphaera parvula]EEF58226.1 Nitrilase/cyanide hydratase and apolipoprotein N-acyltransferase [Pedosphaera parvula Ellin514]